MLVYQRVLGRISPTDFHIFQRGRYTTNQLRNVDVYKSMVEQYFSIYKFININIYSHPFASYVDVYKSTTRLTQTSIEFT